ncbi:MAG TPA: class I SAM-dependent methyltransferase [Spirochaetota bacterium]|nr:class I SAM-dependent methyltransferase [Spirochaetota bacterium]
MKEHHVFPWWAGYLLLNPIRKMTCDPDTLMGRYIKPGMTVLDAGCAVGFFSIPAAEMTGPGGRVICVDPQAKMLNVLMRRAKKRKMDGIIDVRKCSFDSLMVTDVSGQVDVAVLFGVLHEVKDRERCIREISDTLKDNALLIIGEPHRTKPLS